MGARLRPPDFLTASSARALSKPMSTSCSKSDGILAVALLVAAGVGVDGGTC